MKKILWVIVAAAIVSVAGCAGDSDNKKEISYSFLEMERMSGQEFYNLAMKHHHIKDSAGHDLILHEVGDRGWRDYSFSIEHSQECKLCYDIYD